MENNDTHTAEENRAEEESSTVGGMLKTAREARELSIEQIAAELRIESRFLVALEEDNFEEFSAPVFTKGYIKQYGHRLGLEYGDLLAQYYRQEDVRDLTLKHSTPIRIRDEQQVTQWILAGSILALLVGGFALWYLSGSGEPPPVVTSPGAESIEPVLTEELVLEAPFPATPPLPDRATRPVPEPELVAAVADSPNSVVAVVEDDPPAESDLAGPMVQVTISFEQDCWTEVTDARGERQFYGLATAGAVSRFEAQLPLSFLLGNVDAVRLLLDGSPYPIPDYGRRGNRAEFVIAEEP